MKAGIIGLGLIGGSLAKALKKRAGFTSVVAANRNEDVLMQALQDQTIDAYSTEIDDLFSDCDIVFICTPVHTVCTYAEQLKHYVSPHCIVTDVGSTKSSIMQQMKKEQAFVFIGGHPMTGSEKSRYDAAKEHLFENSYYILTPGSTASASQVSFLTEILTAIGAIPIVLPTEEHDKILSFISHVPHVVAASLVNMVEDGDGQGYMHKLAAGGFKDITRIASSNAAMWESICIDNREELLEGLKKFQDALSDFQSALLHKDSEAVRRLFQKSKEYRDSFADRKASSYQQLYELFVDILDQPGSIAKIAVLLAQENINIKNIGNINNREYENGVMQILFESDQMRESGKKVLSQNGYEIILKS